MGGACEGAVAMSGQVVETVPPTRSKEDLLRHLSYDQTSGVYRRPCDDAIVIIPGKQTHPKSTALAQLVLN